MHEVEHHDLVEHSLHLLVVLWSALPHMSSNGSHASHASHTLSLWRATFLERTIVSFVSRIASQRRVYRVSVTGVDGDRWLSESSGALCEGPVVSPVQLSCRCPFRDPDDSMTQKGVYITDHYCINWYNLYKPLINLQSCIIHWEKLWNVIWNVINNVNNVDV